MRSLCTLAFLAILVAGCANPCDDLAERACQAGGEATPECKGARDKAKKASPEERRACEIALELVTTLERAR